MTPLILVAWSRMCLAPGLSALAKLVNSALNSWNDMLSSSPAHGAGCKPLAAPWFIFVSLWPRSRRPSIWPAWMAATVPCIVAMVCALVTAPCCSYCTCR